MKITVEVQNDAGEVVSKYTSYNCLPANTVTVWIGQARWACMDDAMNTYAREIESEKPRKNLDKTVREN